MGLIKAALGAAGGVLADHYLIDSRTLQCGDQSVRLTNRESQLFELLLRSAGKIVSQDEIIESI